MLNSRHRSVRVLGWLVAPIALLGMMLAPSILLLPPLIALQTGAAHTWLIVASFVSSGLVVGLGLLAVRRMMAVMRIRQAYSLDHMFLFQGCLLCLPAIALFFLLGK